MNSDISVVLSKKEYLYLHRLQGLWHLLRNFERFGRTDKENWHCCLHFAASFARFAYKIDRRLIDIRHVPILHIFYKYRTSVLNCLDKIVLNYKEKSFPQESFTQLIQIVNNIENYFRSEFVVFDNMCNYFRNRITIVADENADATRQRVKTTTKRKI